MSTKRKYTTRWIILIIAICITGCQSYTYSSKYSKRNSQWSSWSRCSTSCGEGVRQRVRECPINEKTCRLTTKESKHCFLQFCPSYLSWPRIHFSGTLVPDVTTVNNIRCAYKNDHFSASQLSKEYIGLSEMKGTHTYYKKATGNWNPDGTNQVYFENTFVTSLCVSPGVCLTNDPIVGSEVTETSRGVMAVLDVDWQYATEIWAWKIRIPGVFRADYEASSHHIESARVDNITRKNVGYSLPLMSIYKSKLTNITWDDQYYKQLFNNAKHLSMNIVIDLFNQYSYEGRLSGTIGLTSPDDPKETLATRTLRPSTNNLRGPTPFYIHYEKKVMTVDMGCAIGGRDDGRILASDTGLLDFALLLTRRKFCEYYLYEENSICNNGGLETDLIWRSITTGGEISKRVGEDAAWYLTYGGVMDIDLKHLDKVTWNLLQHSRVAILEQNADGTEKIYMSEFPKGVVIGLQNDPIVRLNPGESKTWYAFVSSYGRPAVGADFDLSIVHHSNANTECSRLSCNMTNGVPSDALQIVSPTYTVNASGLVTFVMNAVKDPGNVRGCGLDGQIYPLRLFARYKTGTRELTFSESGLYTTGGPVAEYQAMTLSLAVHIYNSVPEKKCPTWDDVKSIFIQYYNLYPVMWKSGIIDLHSYTDIKKKSRMIEASMFKTHYNDPRYMPMTRDLSAGKKKLIWNWLKCGMRQFDPPTVAKKKMSTECTKEFVEKETKNIRNLVNKAVMLELSTIPPYVTAWLSLKTEFGRNKEIAEILKTVFNEEMLHMTLAANILNSLGGEVTLTDESTLPLYPTILSSTDTYQLCPDVQVSIEPFSIGLAEDVFSEIEKPAGYVTRQLVYSLAEMWKMLPGKGESTDHVSRKMHKLVEELKLNKVSEGDNFNDETKQVKDNSTESLRQIWNDLKEFAEQKLQDFNTGTTVGDMYANIALRLTVLESCLRISDLESSLNGMENIHNTVSLFAGEKSHQLNDSHWYEDNVHGIPDFVKTMTVEDNGETSSNHQSNSNRPPVFEVVDLRTALEAIVEILYQGEGGSECSPFVTDPKVYASYEGRDVGHEISHYYRFQEIVHGRKITKIKTPPGWVDWKCINVTKCPSLLSSGESYCYAGEYITFYEDGVWPILSNPKAEEYVPGSKAFKLHHQFNLLYTRLLICLEKTFRGDPSNIRNCMALMYDLTITGKRLVQTPLRVLGDTTTVELGNTGKHGAPTWLFVREITSRAGLPLRT